MDRIRQLRKERGLSQAKLAVMADMDPATLNRLERGTGNPNLKTLERVADALQVEVADFFPKALRRSSREPTLLNGLEEERRESIYQHAFRDQITRLAERIDAEADSKGYEPAWILEIDKIWRDTAQILLDYGMLGNPEAFPTEAEYHQSWEIDDALTELKHAVERAWRAQIRVSEQMERQREAAAELDSIWQRSKEADKSSEEALDAIREERSESA